MINNIKGTYLSNFWSVPIVYEGLTYANAESAFQASKCADINERVWFVDTAPQIAKAKGRKVKIRDDWDRARVFLMYDIVKTKFEQHPDLASKLVATGDEDIVEGNTWNDKFWGVCNGEGENRLGKILMIVREEIKC